MPFTSETAYRDGKPKGAINRRSTELARRLREREGQDPAEFLYDLQNNDKEPMDLRAQAANYLLPYLYPKRGPAPSLVYIDEPINLPHQDPRTLQQSNENILYITQLKAQGQIDFVAGDNLIADQLCVRDGLVDESKLALQGADTGDQVIRIIGGMSPLPGTDVIMPDKQLHNGHQFETLPAPTVMDAAESGPKSEDPPPKDGST
jgi:hypothetical protein